jgi:hypothetical protein
VPNRRRRKLSTAMSAVAALAVASPVAAVAVAELATSPAPAPQQREFIQASLITDLPNEIMSALSQGLAQFGINLPPLPSLTGSTPTTGLGSALTNPGLGTTTPSTGLFPGLTSSPATTPLTDSALTSSTLTDPALTPLTSPSTPGLTIPPAGTPNPLLTSPTVPSTVPGLGLPTEQPITAPAGVDGTYPLLGADPLASMPSSSTGGGGLISDLSSAAQQLGVGQVIDLIKGMVMPSITSAVQSAQAAATPAAAGA